MTRYDSQNNLSSMYSEANCRNGDQPFHAYGGQVQNDLRSGERGP